MDTRGECAGKTPYPSPQKAHAQTRRVKARKSRPGRRGVNAYKCSLCGFWHVGEPKF